MRSADCGLKNKDYADYAEIFFLCQAFGIAQDKPV
jgi:hypothetical protein